MGTYVGFWRTSAQTKAIILVHEHKKCRRYLAANGGGRREGETVVVSLSRRYVPANSTGSVPDAGTIGCNTDTGTTIKGSSGAEHFIGTILAIGTLQPAP